MLIVPQLAYSMLGSLHSTEGGHGQTLTNYAMNFLWTEPLLQHSLLSCNLTFHISPKSTMLKRTANQAFYFQNYSQVKYTDKKEKNSGEKRFLQVSMKSSTLFVLYRESSIANSLLSCQKNVFACLHHEILQSIQQNQAFPDVFLTYCSKRYC